MIRTPDRRGFTLIELMIAVVVIGALTMLAFPRMQQFGDRMAIREARNTLAALATQARTRALSQGAPTRLQVTVDSVWIEQRAGGLWQSTGVSEEVFQRGGMNYVGPATLTFLPTGTAVIPGGGEEATLVVLHGKMAKPLVVTRYGRIK